MLVTLKRLSGPLSCRNWRVLNGCSRLRKPQEIQRVTAERITTCEPETKRGMAGRREAGTGR